MATFAEQLNNFSLSETSSPVLAEGLGATKDQAKMVGTDAQKKSTIMKRLEELPTSAQPQAQEIQRAERLLDAPRQEPTPQEAAEAEAAAHLSRLGNIGIQVKNSIDRQLEQAASAQAGQAQVQQSQVAQSLGLTPEQVEQQKQDPNSNYSRISGALNQFLESGDPNDLESAMATIDNLKLYGVSSADARRMVGLTQELMARQTGATVAANVSDQITLGNIDLAEMGFDGGIPQVAEILGISEDELGQMTIDELGDLVQDRQQAELSNVAKLRAELLSAPLGSKRRETILRELRDLGQVGITGIEVQAAEDVEDIDLASQIKVGDEIMEVSDFLADENISRMVEDWIAADPVERERLIPSDKYPELISWIQANQAALSQLSTTAGETHKQYESTQAQNKSFNELRDINTAINPDLMKQLVPGWDPSQSITTSQLQDLQTKFNASAVGQLSADDGIAAQEKRSIINRLNAADRDLTQQLINLPKDDLMAAHAAGQVLTEGPQLSSFLGISPEQGFVLSREQQEKIYDYADVIDDINKENPSLLNNRQIQPMLQQLSPEELRRASKSPEVISDLELVTKKRDQFSKAVTADDKLSAVLGRDMTAQELNSEYQDALKWARLGDRQARDKVSLYTRMFDLPKGADSILPADIDKAYSDISARLAASPQQVLEGQFDRQGVLSRAQSYSSQPVYRGPSDATRKYSQFMSGNVLDSQALAAMPEEDRIDALKWSATTNGAVKIDIRGWEDEPITNWQNAVNFINERKAMDKVDQYFQESGLGSVDALYDITSQQLPPENMQQVRDLASDLRIKVQATPDETERAFYRDALTEVESAVSRWERQRTAAQEAAQRHETAVSEAESRRRRQLEDWYFRETGSRLPWDVIESQMGG